MFEKERFIEACLSALKQKDTHAAVRELVAEAVSDPTEILRALGELNEPESIRFTGRTT